MFDSLSDENYLNQRSLAAKIRAWVSKMLSFDKMFVPKVIRSAYSLWFLFFAACAVLSIVVELVGATNSLVWHSSPASNFNFLEILGWMWDSLPDSVAMLPVWGVFIAVGRICAELSIVLFRLLEVGTDILSELRKQSR